MDFGLKILQVSKNRCGAGNMRGEEGGNLDPYTREDRMKDFRERGLHDEGEDGFAGTKGSCR